MKIRPLVAFKKKKKEYYNNWLRFMTPTGSKKSIENQFYWWFCYRQVRDEFCEKDVLNPFFWNDAETFTNKGTISELGRLLLYGWYYDEIEFTMQVCKWVYNAWLKNNKGFNDAKHKKFVKSIRDNFNYYYHNQKQVKIDLLKEFFNDELETYLPEKPKELKEFEETIEFVNKIKENNLKKDKDFYYKMADKFENYAYYLQGILDAYNIPYESEDEFILVIDEEKEDWVNDIQKKYDDYENNVKFTLANKKNLKII